MNTNGRITFVDIEQCEPEDAFQSWSYATLKVTRGDKIVGIRVKIVSVPQDLIEELNKKAPKPPAKAVMIDPQSDDGRRLGITTRQRVTMPDYSDAVYVEKRDAHDVMFRREVVGRGVASSLKMKDGTLAETPDARYQALQDRGLSGLHFAELAESILKLTQWSEDERELFTTPPTGSTAS